VVSTRISASATLGLLLALGLATPTWAQVIQPPPRSSSGLLGGEPARDANATRQEISVTLSMLGGYSDNIVADAQGTTTAFAPRRSGGTGTGTAELRYSRRQGPSSIDASGRLFANSFRAVDSRLLVGGDADLRARRRLFGATTVSGAVEFQRRPTFGFATFGGAAVDTIALPNDPLLGVSQVRSLTTSASGGVAQEWSARHDTTLTGSYLRSTFGQQGLDMRSNAFDAAHSWAFARTLAAQFSYRRAEAAVVSGVASDRPLESDYAAVGLEYTKALSATRNFRIGGGPAATRIRTFSLQSNATLDYVAPSGFATAALDFGRTWALSADWRREATLVDGLIRQSFLTDSAMLSVGGEFAAQLTFAATGSLANGAPHEGETGSFENQAGTAQIEYTLSRCCSLVGIYSYTHYRLRDLAAVPQGFPNRLERSSLQVGMTVWLPLHGAFPAAGRPTNR
jgi:hypothetical protein